MISREIFWVKGTKKLLRFSITFWDILYALKLKKYENSLNHWQDYLIKSDCVDLGFRIPPKIQLNLESKDVQAVDLPLPH